MKVRLFIGAVIVALFLYWVVEAPLGAAAAIKATATGTGHVGMLVASRLATFLDALM